ncbi:MAG: LPS export ABC transporter periplasmic protein LptC [Bdellovibrionales bacterium]|nr:LPS export ABC transporter periplasmic protein LptC [Bdellovibrionales bacterium]
MLAAAIFLVFIAAAISFGSRASNPSIHKRFEEEPALPSRNSGGSSFILRDFHRSETKDGKIVWEVVAERGQYFPETGAADVEQARVIFHDKDNKPVELHANKAQLDLKESSLNRAVMSGGARLIYNNEIEILSDQASFDQIENSVSTPGKVTITSPTTKTTGDSLQADMRAQEVQVIGNVHTVIDHSGNRRTK